MCSFISTSSPAGVTLEKYIFVKKTYCRRVDMKEYVVRYETLTKKIQDLYPDKPKEAKIVTPFVGSVPIEIETFHDLVMEVGELSFKNPDVMLFYRGQNYNHIKIKYSTLYPTIYRTEQRKDIKFDFVVLEKSAKKLVEL